MMQPSVRHLVRLSLALLVPLAAVGCSESTSAPADEGEPVAFDRLGGFFPAVCSGFDVAQTMVIRSQEEWNGFWDRFQPANQRVAPPSVDFEARMVAVMALGTRSTGGYTVEVAQVREMDDGTLVVRANESIPGDNCTVTQAQTRPLDAVLIPSSDSPVEFEAEARVYGCSTGYNDDGGY